MTALNQVAIQQFLFTVEQQQCTIGLCEFGDSTGLYHRENLAELEHLLVTACLPFST